MINEKKIIRRAILMIVGGIFKRFDIDGETFVISRHQYGSALCRISGQYDIGHGVNEGVVIEAYKRFLVSEVHES